VDFLIFARDRSSARHSINRQLAGDAPLQFLSRRLSSVASCDQHHWFIVTAAQSENGPMSENPLTEILADIKRLEDATKANLSAIITLLPSIASNHADLVCRVTDLEKGLRP
jgi:hypothetical protein